MAEQTSAEPVAADKTTETKPKPNAFTQAIREINKGALLEELDGSLRDVIRAVRKLGRKGKLKLELTIRPASKGDTDSLMLDHAVTATPPEPDRPADFFYAHGEDGLGKHHPEQLTISLRTGPSEQRTVRGGGEG